MESIGFAVSSLVDMRFETRGSMMYSDGSYWRSL